jgi:hypothetical protein
LAQDFCSHPDRQIGLAYLLMATDAAAKEVYRVAKLGLKGPSSLLVGYGPMWHPVWEPLWKRSTTACRCISTFPAVPASVRAA